MSPEVLRRKLQKKKKHTAYAKCPQCGGRLERRISDQVEGAMPRLFRVCVSDGYNEEKCGYKDELFWTGKPS